MLFAMLICKVPSFVDMCQQYCFLNRSIKLELRDKLAKEQIGNLNEKDRVAVYGDLWTYRDRDQDRNPNVPYKVRILSDA